MKINVKQVVTAMVDREIENIFAALDVTSLAPPTPVGGGWSETSMWRAELAEGPHILRVFDRSQEPDAEREAGVLEHLGALGFPVPRVVARGGNGRFAYLLLTWLNGQTLGQELAASGDPRSLGEQFGRMQAHLHQIEAPAGLPAAVDWPSPDAYPEPLLQALPSLQQRRDRLLHLDFHPLNVLVEDGSICGLIDWTNARRGDPRFDVARTFLILRVMSRLELKHFAQFRSILRPFISGWHQVHKQDGEQSLTELPPFLAWAGYGLLFDLNSKSAESLPSGARSGLDQMYAYLRRKIGDWMALAGLEQH